MAEIETMAVLGAGTMGRGIAQVGVQAGYRVILRETTDELAARGRSGIEDRLRKAAADGRIDTALVPQMLSRLSTTTSLADAVRQADLIIEAIPEDLELKRSLFVEVDRLASPGAILASNTSSLSVSALAEATGRPALVVGMHFFNPVDRMQLLEIVTGRGTAAETVEAVRRVGDRMGKTCIVVKDSPGFATSRLGLVLGLEAIRMVEEGVAGPAEIDTAMELGYRHPMGPLKLTDLVGLDVRLAIAEHLHRTLGSEAFRPPNLLRRMVAEGKLGRKSGLGFYPWT